MNEKIVPLLTKEKWLRMNGESWLCIAHNPSNEVVKF